ncbi:MAG: diaminobutyrate--2-oxoglutarate transaminase family protein [Acidimicrobiia bacterium]
MHRSTALDLAADDPLLARQSRRESSARSYPRRLPVALVAGRGSTVVDTTGRTYIDCLAGAGALALGHHHPVVTEALQAALQAEVPLTTLDLTTPVKDAFVEELFSVLPPSLADGRIQFCSPTGADAVEAALKLTRTATGRLPVLAFGGGYHGMTQGALALTGARGPKEPLPAPGGAVQHLPFPAAYRCPFGVGGESSATLAAAVLRWTLTDDHSGTTTPAAVVIEPVQGEGGVNPVPPAFGAAVRSLTSQAGVPLVVDEVQTGLGRTGDLWGSTAVGLDPDVLVLSKAIGGGLPLAVIVYRAELDTWAPGAHAGTFRGNQLAMAAGTATIREVVRAGLAERAGTLGAHLRARLDHELGPLDVVAEVRGRGLMIGIEVVDPTAPGPDGLPVPDGALARRVQHAALERGLIVEIGGRGDAVVRLLPPLVLTDEEAEQVVDVLVASFAAVSAGAAR